MKYNKLNVDRHVKYVENKKSRLWVTAVQMIRKALESRYETYTESPTCATRNSFRSAYFNSKRFMGIVVNLRPGAERSKVVEDLRIALQQCEMDYKLTSRKRA